MRHWLVAFLAAVSVALSPGRAQAGYYYMKIVQVFAGTSFAPNAQFIELQMYADGQNNLTGHSVKVYDEYDTLIATYPITTNPVFATNQSYVLLATAEAEALFNITADVTMTADLLPSGGKACYDAIDCVAWGSYSVTDATVGTPFPGGLRMGLSIRRKLDIAGSPSLLEAGDDTNDSANDFFLSVPSPVTNTGQTGSLPIVDGGTGSGGTTGSGGAPPGSGSTANSGGDASAGGTFSRDSGVVTTGGAANADAAAGREDASSGGSESAGGSAGAEASVGSGGLSGSGGFGSGGLSGAGGAATGTEGAISTGGSSSGSGGATLADGAAPASSGGAPDATTPVHEAGASGGYATASGSGGSGAGGSPVVSSASGGNAAASDAGSAPGGSRDNGGCGCRVGAAPNSRGSFALVALLAFAATARRRRAVHPRERRYAPGHDGSSGDALEATP
jgi:MYXO-CTERM domain-containing protein